MDISFIFDQTKGLIVNQTCKLFQRLNTTFKWLLYCQVKLDTLFMKARTK